jgi:uncharacterized membrane protein YtjA (UPF0391 family)
MLRWALIFLIISIVAGGFGFTGVARTSKKVAKLLFFIFIALFILILVFAKMIF